MSFTVTISVGSVLCFDLASLVRWCQIECDQTYSNGACFTRRFNASLATSLTLNCRTASCMLSEVWCPEGEGTSCVIDCQDSCSSISIHSASDTFVLTCSGAFSCGSAQVTLLSDYVDTVTIECSLSYSCSSADFALNAASIGTLSINCGGDSSCAHATFTSIAEITQPVTVGCSARYSCNATLIELPLASQLSVDCSGIYACWFTEIHCPSQEQGACALACPHYQGLSACYENRIVVPEDYTYGYLDVACDSYCGPYFVQCEDDYKGKLETAVHYDYSSGECDNTGASYCCPFGQCLDYNGRNSSQGDAVMTVSLPLSAMTGDNVTRTTIDSTASHVESQIMCSEQDCLIECTALLSCVLATMQIESTGGHNVTILCAAQFSCLSLTVVTAPTSRDMSLNIICAGADACSQMAVNTTNFATFVITD